MFKKMSPGRLIVLGFSLVIILGTILLLLPFSANEGVHVSFFDALFTSTSSVCVTGMLAVDIKDIFSVYGKIIIAVLIQIGGLGFACISVGFFLIANKKVSFKDHLVLKEV